MIINYEKGRSELRKMHRNLGNTLQDQNDKSKINSMIADMSDVIEWLQNGREPGKIRGIDKNAVYQCNSIDNMDMFPSLEIKPKERELTEDEKRAVYNALRELSPRERETFVFKHAYMWTFTQIAQELGVGKSTAQSYYERAKKKIEACRTNAVHLVC